MRFTLLLLIFLLVTPGAQPVHADTVAAVKSAAVVSGERVLLKEIAEPVEDMSTWNDIKDTVLWPAPSAEGRRQTFSQRRLAELLRRYLKGGYTALALPDQIIIQRGGKLIEQSELERGLVASLKQRAVGMQGEAEFTDFRLPPYLFLERASNTFTYEITGTFDPGRVGFRITEQDAMKRTVRKVSGNCSFNLWVNVPTAARPLNRGEELTPADVAYARKNAAYLKGQAWNGKRFGVSIDRPIGTGQVIYADKLKKTPVVQKGATVNLIYHGRNIRLSVPAVVLADAGQGEMVTVENMQSGKKLAARVRDAETVVVQ